MEEGVTFQRLKTWKASKDPQYAVKKARVGHLYAIADGEAIPDEGEPEVIFCLDVCRHRDYAEGLGCRLSLAVMTPAFFVVLPVLVSA